MKNLAGIFMSCVKSSQNNRKFITHEQERLRFPFSLTHRVGRTAVTDEERRAIEGKQHAKDERYTESLRRNLR